MKVVIGLPDQQTRGGYLPGAAEGDDAKKWSGKLPVSGDYTIVVDETRGNAEYALTITIN